ncbi:hypothetical protein BpHYR1_013384 [Brachionus plicatilis]|uniref:Uncharacterized protein n=1 Tax=Brachionus plicatilis TaxID=10195 RepID=A0A3M7QZN1_BRAPC|nr:hypothetical protein BpHYR1_013384 [Brachionus plicatilis]
MSTLVTGSACSHNSSNQCGIELDSAIDRKTIKPYRCSHCSNISKTPPTTYYSSYLIGLHSEVSSPLLMLFTHWLFTPCCYWSLRA